MTVAQHPRVSPLVAALVGAVLLGAVGWLIAPAPVAPGPERTGDPALADRLAGLAGPGQYAVAAALVDRGATTTAGVGGTGDGVGVDDGTPFEIGSVTKTLTGAVLADLERQGVVTGDDRLRDVVTGRAWGPVGDVTLAELASHRAGLPRLAGGNVWDSLTWGIRGSDPYESTPEELFAAADAAELSGRGESRYSNLGSALLGQALAARTGTPYPELLARSVTGPLGMTATVVPDEPPAGAAASHRLDGRTVAPWISAGDAPAGIGIWSTTSDLGRYATALLAPGTVVADAAVGRWPSEIGLIGYGWNTYTAEGRTMIWKNGATGGSSSTVLAEPATGRAVAVLANSEAGVDALAAALLDVPPPSAADPAPGAAPEEPGALDTVLALLPAVVATLLPLWAGFSVLLAARGRRTGPPTRAGFAAAAGSALLLVVLARLFGPVGWLFVPFWVLSGVLVGIGAGLAVVRWSGWEPGPRSGWISGGVQAALGAAGLALLVG